MLDIRLTSSKEMLVMLKGMLAMFLLLSLKLLDISKGDVRSVRINKRMSTRRGVKC